MESNDFAIYAVLTYFIDNNKFYNQLELKLFVSCIELQQQNYLILSNF